MIPQVMNAVSVCQTVHWKRGFPPGPGFAQVFPEAEGRSLGCERETALPGPAQLQRSFPPEQGVSMRYSDPDLETLLDDIESDLVERKESWKGDAPETGRQAVCAFANDLPDHHRPGVLFVGAKGDGNPSGLPITDELLCTLSDIRTDGNTLPPPSILVEKRILRGTEMAVVTVQPSDTPPVRYKGRIWVRCGPRRAIAMPRKNGF